MRSAWTRAPWSWINCWMSYPAVQLRWLSPKTLNIACTACSLKTPLCVFAAQTALVPLYMATRISEYMYRYIYIDIDIYLLLLVQFSLFIEYVLEMYCKCLWCTFASVDVLMQYACEQYFIMYCIIDCIFILYFFVCDMFMITCSASPKCMHKLKKLFTNETCAGAWWNITIALCGFVFSIVWSWFPWTRYVNVW